MSGFMIYLAFMLDNINGLAIGVLMFFCAVLVSSAIFLLAWPASKDTGEEKQEVFSLIKKHKLWKKWSISLYAIAVAALILTFTPTTKQAVTICIAPKIIKSKAIKDIPPLFVEYIEKELQLKIKDVGKLAHVPRVQ